MHKLKHNSTTLVSIPAFLLIVSFIPLLYVKGWIQASWCTMDGVWSSVEYSRGLIHASCRPEFINWDLFELSGGILVGSFALGFFLVSMAKKWEKGVLFSLPLASYQIFYAYLENQKGFLFASSPELVYILVAIIATLSFLVTWYWLTKDLQWNH